MAKRLVKIAKELNVGTSTIVDFLNRNGFEIDKASKELKRIQQLSDTDFLTHLEQQKNAIVSYHLANNPFYKTFLKGLDYYEWNSCIQI